MLLPPCDTKITRMEGQKSCAHENIEKSIALNLCMCTQNGIKLRNKLFSHSNEQKGNKECNVPIELFSPGVTSLFGVTFIRGRNTTIYHNYKRCQGGFSPFSIQVLWGLTENENKSKITKKRWCNNIPQITEKYKKTRR